MTRRIICMIFYFLFISIILFSVMSCSQEQPAKSREFIRATGIMTKYNYSGGTLGAVGIPAGAEFLLGDRKTVVANAEGAELIDEDNERRIRVKMNFTPGNKHVATVVAQFRPTGMGAKVRKTVVNDQWESRYIYEGQHAALFFSMPRIETYDLKNGKKVSETKNIEILGDGLFSGEEFCYDQNKVIFHSYFVRHAGTGLLVEEKVKKGRLPRDYHHYELLLMGWPDGSR